MSLAETPLRRQRRGGSVAGKEKGEGTDEAILAAGQCPPRFPHGKEATEEV
jgi:hypothetical protein